MALPLIDALAEESRPVVIAGNVVRSVFADRSDHLDFGPGFKVKGLGGLREAVRWLRGEQFRRVLLVNRSFRSALAARLAKIPERIGHATEARSALLTTRITYRADRSEAACYLDLIGQGNRPAQPKLHLLPSEGPVQRPTMVGIQPGARYASKRLPFTTLAKVAAELASRGLDLGLLGGPDEADQMQEFSRMSGGLVKDTISSPDLRQTMRSMAGLCAVIGSDTGLMHVSAALGTPTVVAFGPNSPAKWGHAVPTYRALQGPVGIRSITSAMVIEAFEEVTNGRREDSEPSRRQ
ncbi:MAG: hypothetical protein HONBIEJF_02925 [Fimbriimonadaceae bacterium]|nr:hypothetical protein [Fimbriimonadaceae bacterium]